MLGFDERECREPAECPPSHCLDRSSARYPMMRTRRGHADRRGPLGMLSSTRRRTGRGLPAPGTSDLNAAHRPRNQNPRSGTKILRLRCLGRPCDCCRVERSKLPTRPSFRSSTRTKPHRAGRTKSSIRLKVVIKIAHNCES